MADHQVVDPAAGIDLPVVGQVVELGYPRTGNPSHKQVPCHFALPNKCVGYLSSMTFDPCCNEVDLPGRAVVVDLAVDLAVDLVADLVVDLAVDLAVDLVADLVVDLAVDPVVDLVVDLAVDLAVDLVVDLVVELVVDLSVIQVKFFQNTSKPFLLTVCLHSNSFIKSQGFSIILIFFVRLLQHF